MDSDKTSHGEKPAKARPRKTIQERKSAFAGHLKSLAKARKKTAELIGEKIQNGDTPGAVLDLAWEIVFDHFCADEGLGVAELNTLAGVVHKLVSSGSSMKPKKKPAGSGLDENSIREIERRLGML